MKDINGIEHNGLSLTISKENRIENSLIFQDILTGDVSNMSTYIYIKPLEKDEIKQEQTQKTSTQEPQEKEDKPRESDKL